MWTDTCCAPVEARMRCAISCSARERSHRSATTSPATSRTRTPATSRRSRRGSDTERGCHTWRAGRHRPCPRGGDPGPDRSRSLEEVAGTSAPAPGQNADLSGFVPKRPTGSSPCRRSRTGREGPPGSGGRREGGGRWPRPAWDSDGLGGGAQRTGAVRNGREGPGGRAPCVSPVVGDGAGEIPGLASRRALAPPPEPWPLLGLR
jgi:hypothetical protein